MFYCPVEGCTEKFTFRVQLKRHEWTHVKVVPFACPADGCSKTFKNPQTFQSHAR